MTLSSATASDGLHGQIAPPDVMLATFREALVDNCLRGLLWVTPCVLALSIWRNFIREDSLRSPLAFITVSLATLVVVLVFAGRKQLPYRFKAVTLITLLFAIGAGGMASFGSVSPTGNFFALGLFIATILYARSIVFALVAGVVLIIVLIGLATVSGLNVIPHDLNQQVRQPAAWISVTLTMALSTGLVATAMSAFMRALYGMLGDLYRQQIEIRAQRDRISHLASHDHLTGLPTLQLAVDRSQMAIEDARRHGHRIAYLFIDLDGFKAINDQFGHDAGDLLLKEVAQRLKLCIRATDTAARIGGDEFVVILTRLSDPRAPAGIADKIIERLAEPVPYGSQLLRVGSSIGIALYPDHAQDPDELKKAADLAMYAVKSSGKNTYAFAPDAAVDQSASQACRS